MPDIKHNFTGGKMNKDLDERLVPKGEYRDAMNIKVQTSEESGVGTIQNILGNNFGCDYTNVSWDNPIPSGSTTVGSISDEKNDSLYWLVAGSNPSGTVSYPISSSVSFKDMIMRTNKSTTTGCEPVFVDLWKYCSEIDPLPGFSDNSLTLVGGDGYDIIEAGMYATGYGPTGSVEFGPTLVTGSGNINMIPMNYNVGAVVTPTPFTPPTIQIGDVTNTSVSLRGFWNDNGGAAGTGGYTDIHYDIAASQTNYPPSQPAQGNLPPDGAVQFWIPATDLTAMQASHLQPGVSMSSIFPQAYHTYNNNSPVLNGFTSVLIDDVVQGQVFDHLGSPINAYIITIDAEANRVYDCWSESNGTQHGCAWYTGIWQKNASISAGFQNGEAHPFYELQADITPLTISVGVSTPTSTIEINDPNSQNALDEIFNILFDFDGVNSYPANIDATTGQPVQIQVNSSLFPPNSCIDPNSVIAGPNGFSLGPPMTFSNIFEVIDCDTGASNVASGFNSTGELVLLNTTVANGVKKVWLRDRVDLSVADSVCFEADKTLNFEPNKLITGINIIDDMLFWTDGYHDSANKLQGTEPKKINIKRSIQGTHISGKAHTDLYVDGVNQGPAREEHVTVIRKAPLYPPTLEMTSQVREGILGGVNVLLSNATSPFQTPFFGKTVGSEVWIVVDAINNIHPNFAEGDILRVQANSTDFNLPATYDLRLEIIQKEDPGFDIPNVVDTTSGFQTAYRVKILTISEEDKLEETTFFTILEEGDSLFERKFPRFAYRYKYVDNEYSSFGPFSEVAFVPGNFSYAPIEAYNLGMTNRIKSLKIKDFVSNETPKDVVRVDILYKNETSPTVYLLDSVSRDDSTTHWNTSSYEVTSENIFAALPASQSLRVWDNVPRLARAQEITGNRLVYGNYLQGYDIMQHQYNSTILVPSITTSLSSRVVDSTDYSGNQSIKSLRTYSVGVIWGDKYGRETPVITSTDSSLIVPKSKSLDSSYLTVDIDTSPYWADYYRYYVKETSNEYYNLPVDRVYDAEDGNIWVSFPSVDRNKVDEDTYIILKKGFDSNELILEEARYKIVAIESEAPEHIRTSYELLARSNTDSSRYPDSCNIYGGSASTPCVFGDGWNAPSVGRKGFSLKYSHWSGDYENDGTTYAMALPSPIALWEEVKENSGNSTIDELFVSFSKEITDADGLTVTTESSKYRIVNVEKILDDPDDLDSDVLGWYMDLDSTILAEDDFIVGDGNMQDDNMHQRFWKRAVRKKAEFDGRFFVKILSDTSANINLKSRVGAIGNWKVDASMKLYSIDDPKLSITQNDYNVATAGNPSISTRTADHWNTILKFGGSTPKSRWFIDRASFASNQMGSPTASSGDYSSVQTSFGPLAPSGLTFESCDTTSYLPQQMQSSCVIGGNQLENLPPLGQSNPFFPWVGGFDLNVGTGESSGMIGMKGVHESSSEKFFDLGYSKLGTQGATGETTDYNLGWEEDDGSSAVVGSLKIDKRFKLKGDTDDVVYKILGVTKHRLFNYQGKKTASTSTTPAYFFDNVSGMCSDWWNVQHMEQVSEMGNPKNRRVTYRIKYEVDHASSPTGTCTNDAADPFNDCPKLSENEVFSDITSSSSVVMYFIEEFRVGGENPISNNPAIFETEPKEDVGLDLYYEASSSLTVFPITNENKFSYIPMGSTIMLPPTISALGSIPEGIFITNWEYIDPTSPVYKIKLSLALDQNQFDLLTSQTHLNLQKDNGEIAQAKIEGGTGVAGYYSSIEISPISRTGLSWFNCWSFNNGVESNRVGDTFNKPFLTNGATVSTTVEEGFKEEHRKYGLIYSGLYNSNSGANGLNQFITAEKITKDINPIYGSVQKLHSGWGQGGDLVALCEDRTLKILANKDALYNADGNPNVTSANSVLGQTIPYSGEYGISKNPESFASDAYRAYFTDKVRGAVMRLSMDGLTPISEHGMKGWFRDNLKLNNSLIGSYDDRQGEYNITLPITTENSPQARTVSFSEGVKGWVSFKSFVCEDGISCANDYYTFKNGNLYKHHDKTVDRNTFYPTVGVPGNYTNSSFTVLINESPGTVKTFHTLNYEGSQSKIDQLTTYDIVTPGTTIVTNTFNDSNYYNLTDIPGWYVQSIKTDLEEGSLNEFIEKEGKWFNYIKGVSGSITDGVNINGFSNYNTSFQGLGRLAGTGTVSSVFGCTDGDTITSSDGYDYPSSTNYDENAVVDDSSCITTVPGCTDPSADANYNNLANWDIWANTGVLHTGACQYHGCTDSTADNYDASANFNTDCTYPTYGCQDNSTFIQDSITYNTYSNFDNDATAACDGVNDPLLPCVADANGTMQSGSNCCCSPVIVGCTSPTADNYCDNCNTDDGSCLYTILGCTAAACNYDDNANTDDGSCAYCNDISGNNYDGVDGNGNTLASCDTYCTYCKDPINFQSTGNTSPSEIQISWEESIANAPVQKYKVRYRVSGSSDPWTVIQNASGSTGNGTTITYGISGLAPNTSYDIQIHAVCVAGQSLHNPTHFTWTSWSTIVTASTNFVPVAGCMDEYGDNNPYGGTWVCNFNEDATHDPGGYCDYNSCTGCMDSAYGEFCGNCWDTTTQTVVSDGTGTGWLGQQAGDCVTLIVNGCTDATMFNYDSTANTDDGSCEPFVYGCMDSTTLTYDGSIAATNYDCSTVDNPNSSSPCTDGVNTDDSSCTYDDTFTIEWVASNDPLVTGSYTDGIVAVIHNVSAAPVGIDLQWRVQVAGSNLSNGYPAYLIQDDGGTQSNSMATIESQLLNGGKADLCWAPLADYQSLGSPWLIQAGGQGATWPSIPGLQSFFNNTWTYVFGCTDSDACNFDPTANLWTPTNYPFSWQQSCEYPAGCTDPVAYNYDSSIDPSENCFDNDDCVYCSTDPDVVNATITTTVPMNTHYISWDDMGTNATNGVNTGNITAYGSPRPAYNVQFRWAFGQDPLSAWEDYEFASGSIDGQSCFASTRIPATPANIYGVQLNYSVPGLPGGGTGAYNPGAKWQLRVSNKCSDCNDGDFLETPVLTIT